LTLKISVTFNELFVKTKLHQGTLFFCTAFRYTHITIRRRRSEERKKEEEEEEEQNE